MSLAIRLAGGLAVPLALALATSGAVATDSVTPTPVKTAPYPIYEGAGAADGNVLAWSRYREGANVQNYFVQRGHEPPLRVNHRGTFGDGGGVDLPWVIFSETDKANWSPDLYWFNVRNGRRFPLRSSVNTRHSEYSPTVSGEFVLFTREVKNARGRFTRVVLFNRATGEQQILARGHQPPSERATSNDVNAGQVNGVFAVWTRIVSSYGGTPSGKVLRYNLITGEKTRLTAPVGSIAVDSAVSSDGTAYWLRSNPESLVPATLVRSPVNGVDRTVLEGPIASGAGLYVDDRVRGTRRVLFPWRVDDASGRSHTDLYQVLDRPPAPKQ